ncbi:EamA family transporter [Rossellomorea vietnamensis]|uniref:EamA family transporter n=1 Tax=Rossellomorea vietnamensis TaxID=218284 RepID=A0A5D4MAL7_9BACI|nr:EamA family transporter [Rossellomorea vietnamensis]TYR98944.1 EamA family transporter [Rossellomorea vietnamensis]
MNKVIASFKKNGTGIGLMIVAAIFTASGQLFWKLSETELNLYLLIGFGLYGLGAVLMILAFRFGSLSVLHPFLSVGYIISTILGVMILQEELTAGGIAGVVLIIIGVALIGGGDE